MHSGAQQMAWWCRLSIPPDEFRFPVMARTVVVKFKAIDAVYKAKRLGAFLSLAFV
jgi:hypothetical protein